MLRETAGVPSALAELAFISDPPEATLLARPDVQQGDRRQPGQDGEQAERRFEGGAVDGVDTHPGDQRLGVVPGQEEEVEDEEGPGPEDEPFSRARRRLVHAPQSITAALVGSDRWRKSGCWRREEAAISRPSWPPACPSPLSSSTAPAGRRRSPMRRACRGSSWSG